MKEKLIQTLKAWPIITLVTVALCYVTKAGAEAFFGISLESQSTVELVKALVKHMCSNVGWHKVFFRDVWALTLIALQAAILAPVIEETVFRWILWRLPRPALEWVPAITSSALFSAAHYIVMPWPNDAFIALFFFGLAQCWLYKKTGSLWCAMVNHALFNTTNLVLLVALPQ